MKTNRSPLWYLPGILFGVVVIGLVFMSGQFGSPLSHLLIATALAVIFGSATKIANINGVSWIIASLLWFCWVATGLAAVFYLFVYLGLWPGR